MDDHPLIHQVMRAIVKRALNPDAIFHSNDLQQAIECAQDLRNLDLVVLDLGLPGCHDISAVTEFRKKFPRPKIVVLSVVDQRETVIAAMDAGASGYVTKGTPVPVIGAALKLVAAGGRYAPLEILRSSGLRNAKPLSALGLTERELEVLRLLVRGLTNCAIAAALNISQSTVKQHARSVFHALGVSTRTEVIVAAARLGLIFE